MTTTTLTDANGLTPEDIADAITGSAAFCAKRHVADGWNLLPDAYRVGDFHEDVAEVAKLLEREALSEERVALETAIRAELVKAADRQLASVEAMHDGDREARHPSE